MAGRLVLLLQTHLSTLISETHLLPSVSVSSTQVNSVDNGGVFWEHGTSSFLLKIPGFSIAHEPMEV